MKKHKYRLPRKEKKRFKKIFAGDLELGDITLKIIARFNKLLKNPKMNDGN